MDLPEITPPNLSPKLRLKWYIAHFTQLTLEDEDSVATAFNGALSDSEGEDEKRGPGSRSASADNEETGSGILGQFLRFRGNARGNVEKKPTTADGLAVHAGATDRKVGYTRSLRNSNRARELNSEGGGARKVRPIRRRASSRQLRNIYSGAPIYVRGRGYFFLSVIWVLVMSLFLRECSTFTFKLTMGLVFVVLYFLCIRGDPGSIGIVFDQSNINNKSKREMKERLQAIKAMDERTAGALASSSSSSSASSSASASASSSLPPSSDTTRDHKKAEPLTSDSRTAASTSTASSSSSSREGKDLYLVKGGGTLTRKPEIYTKSTCAEIPPMSYCEAKGEDFKVRMPPNYAWTKAKAPSAHQIYEVTAIDLYTSETKIDDIGQHLYLPHRDGSVDAKTGEDPRAGYRDGEETFQDKYGLPEYLIVSWQLPLYAPANPVWGVMAGDGEGCQIVIRHKISDLARKELESGELTHATKLYKRFFASEHKEGADEPLHERVKVIARVVNMEEIEMNAYLKNVLISYNGKPFLTTPDAKFFRKRHYYEIDVDVYTFCYLARKVLYGLFDALDGLVFDMAIVVEGKGDEEQPEQVLQCCRLGRLQPSLAKRFHDCKVLIRDHQTEKSGNAVKGK